jgi:hypothetical protein
MKKSIVIISILFSLSLYAQEKKSNGFLSLNMGTSIPLGEFASKDQNSRTSGLAKTGFNMNLVHFGYNFGDKFGVCASWYGNAYYLTLGNGSEVMWSSGGIMAGPMITIPISDRFLVDFKGQIGFNGTTLKEINSSTEYTGTSICLDLGSQLRYNFAPKWGLLFSIDYFNTNPSIKNFRDQQITCINTNLGIVFNFKKTY